MTKKIEIPLEGRIIKSVPIKFPNACVFCGAPGKKTLPKRITRKYSSKSKVSNSNITGEYEMNPIDIPYCEQHFDEITTIEAKEKRLAGFVQHPLIAISALISFLLL